MVKASCDVEGYLSLSFGNKVDRLNCCASPQKGPTVEAREDGIVSRPQPIDIGIPS